MIKYQKKELLGQTLRKAGLVSLAQIQVALMDREYNQDLLIGEILALRGWIEQQTVDFFADEWQPLLEQLERYPLGYYLVKSGLLTGEQTYLILEEQKKLWIKFGSIAVINGWLEQETLDFFLESLFPGTSSGSPAIGAKLIQKEEKLKKERVDTDDRSTESEIDYEDIPWID